MNRNYIASELVKAARSVVAERDISINEVRRDLKRLGFKVKTKWLSWGPHATFYDMDGFEMPSIYHGKDAIVPWQPLIDYLKNIRRRQIEVVDREGEHIYGFGQKKRRNSAKEVVSGKKVFLYEGFHSTVEFAKVLGWREDPEVDDEYLDSEGYLDEDKALNAAFKFIRRKGWKVDF